MQKNIRPREILQQRRRRLRFVTIILLLAALGYGLYWWLTQREWVRTDDAFVEGHLVFLSPRVSGHVVEVLVGVMQTGMASAWPGVSGLFCRLLTSIRRMTETP